MCYTDQAVKGETSLRYAAVAQLDRVTGYEPVGRGFESLQPYQKERHDESRAFLFAFRRPLVVSTLWHIMSEVGKAAPAQFPACGREFMRHSASGPEGTLDWVVFLLTVVPSSSSQALYCLRRIFYFLAKCIVCFFSVVCGLFVSSAQDVKLPAYLCRSSRWISWTEPSMP